MPLRLRSLRSVVLGLAAASAVLLVACGQDTAAVQAAAAPQAADPVAPPSPDGIPLAEPHAAAVHEPSSPQAWGGPRKDSDATLSDRVVRYAINAKLNPQTHEIDGLEHLTWRNRSAQPVKAVYLHLYLNAFEHANSTYFTEKRNLDFGVRSDVSIKDGEWGHVALGEVKQGEARVPTWFVHPDGGSSTDHTVVRLDLPEAVAPGASTTLEIPFHDQLPRVIERTGYFGSFHLVGQWFPKIAVLELPGERGAKTVRWNAHEFHTLSEFYADYGSYDVRISVPKEYTVGATGEEVETNMDLPGLITHRFLQDDVHDFAWTADKRTAKPLEGEYRGEGSPVVKVKVLYPPEYEASAAPVLKATLDSLAYFSKTLGPYPYKTVTAVIPPFNAEEAGGMEYPTFFTAEADADPRPGTADRSSLDFTVIHEFGHGYFYGILGSNEFEEPMLDEGLNQYWDMRMMRDLGQAWSLSTPFMKQLGLNLSSTGFTRDRIAAMRHEPSDPLGGNSWDRLSSMGYASVYMRTSTTLRDLEDALGKPVMEKAFKLYYQRWKFRHPDIADLRDALAEASGKPELVNAM
ncbi:MAG: M1 family metallopeptidase, partial [Paucibacter sp.]|nr:M1 family metallopeptidase [Roseateles sp.]